MAAMMKNMHDPNYRENLEDKLKDLKQDPELAPIMQEIEQGGPAAMMKYAAPAAAQAPRCGARAAAGRAERACMPRRGAPAEPGREQVLGRPGRAGEAEQGHG